MQAAEGNRAVHVEEISGERGRGLGLQELPPRRVGVPLWRGRDLHCLEDPADRGSTDLLAELEQLTLDPVVSPAVVLGGEPLDQRGDLGADPWPSRPARVGPPPDDQAAVPPQKRCRE